MEDALTLGAVAVVLAAALVLVGCGSGGGEAQRAKDAAASLFKEKVEFSIGATTCIRTASPDVFLCSAPVRADEGTLHMKFSVSATVVCDAAGGPCRATINRS